MKKVGKLLSTVFVALAVLLALLLAGVRLLGVYPYVVLSASMAPNYPTGSMIYVKPAVFQDIRVGDPITFHLSTSFVTATHRVIRIDEAKRAFYTKGDANETADGAPVTADNLIGVPVFCIPVLGYIASFVSAPPGVFITAGLVLVYLLVSAVPFFLEKAKKHDGDCSPQQKKTRGCKPVNLRAKG